MSNEKRALYQRAKFMGPIWCSISAVLVFGYAMYQMPMLDGEQLKALVTITTATITALMTLGLIIGGGAAAHDTARDWMSSTKPKMSRVPEEREG